MLQSRMARLSRADMETALAFAAELATAAPARERADSWLLERIARVIGAEVVGYAHFEAGRVVHEAEFPGPVWMPTEHEWDLLRTQNPFTNYARRTGQPHFLARRLTDVVDIRIFRTSELYRLGSDDRPHAMQTRMPGRPGTHWTVEVARGGRNFSARDLLLLDTLRPSLVAYEAYRALADTVAQLQARPVGDVARGTLSPRENEVMDLVAKGASNAQIAERLWISPETVRKHLENVYFKLDVGSRTAALARTGRS